MQFYKIPLHPLCQPYTVTVVDGRVTSSDVITHFVCVLLVIDNHIETTDMFVTKLGHYPVILGIPWLRLHDPHVHWKANTLTFNSTYCLSHCLTASKSTTVYGLSVIPKSLPPYACLSARVPLSIPLDTKIPEDLPQSMLNIAAIGAAPFDLWVKCYPMEVFAVLLKDIKKALEPKKHINPAIKPKEYHKFLDIFSRQEADMLPVHQSYDHKIPLEDGKQPTFGALYGMSQDELKVLQKYQDDHLYKGFI